MCACAENLSHAARSLACSLPTSTTKCIHSLLTLKRDLLCSVRVYASLCVCVCVCVRVCVQTEMQWCRNSALNLPLLQLSQPAKDLTAPHADSTLHSPLPLLVAISFPHFVCQEWKWAAASLTSEHRQQQPAESIRRKGTVSSEDCSFRNFGGTLCASFA